MNSPPVSLGSLRATGRGYAAWPGGRVGYADPVAALVAPRTDVEAGARCALRDQIARLERELASVLATTYPRIAVQPEPEPARPRAPRSPPASAMASGARPSRPTPRRPPAPACRPCWPTRPPTRASGSPT